MFTSVASPRCKNSVSLFFFSILSLHVDLLATSPNQLDFSTSTHGLASKFVHFKKKKSNVPWSCHMMPMRWHDVTIEGHLFPLGILHGWSTTVVISCHWHHVEMRRHP